MGAWSRLTQDWTSMEVKSRSLNLKHRRILLYCKRHKSPTSVSNRPRLPPFVAIGFWMSIITKYRSFISRSLQRQNWEAHWIFSGESESPELSVITWMRDNVYAKVKAPYTASIMDESYANPVDKIPQRTAPTSPVSPPKVRILKVPSSLAV